MRTVDPKENFDPSDFFDKGLHALRLDLKDRGMSDRLLMEALSAIESRFRSAETRHAKFLALYELMSMASICVAEEMYGENTSIKTMLASTMLLRDGLDSIRLVRKAYEVQKVSP